MGAGRAGWQRALATVAAVAMVAGVLAATLAAVSQGSGAATVTVVAHLSQDWTDFDIQAQERGANGTLAAAPYDRLLALVDGKFVPYLGTVVKQTPTSATFRIRSGATCADGTRVTPQVVYESLKSLIERPKLTNFLNNYWGAGPYAVALDAKTGTLTFRTGTPYRPLLFGFAATGSGIVCPAGLRALAADPNALKTQFFGSGPYQLVSATHGDQVVFKLRPEWSWGPQGRTAKQLADTVVFRIVLNGTTAANLMLTGEIDVEAAAATEINRLAASSDLAQKKFEAFLPQSLVFNMLPGHPTVQEPIRAAIMAAVDPKAWRQAALDGRGTLTPSVFVPGVPCFDKKTYDLYPSGGVARGRDLLQRAGYTWRGDQLYSPGGDPIRVNLLTSTSFNLGGEYLLNQLKALGIDVEFDNLDSTNWGARFLRSQFDVTISFNTQAVTEPINLGFYYGPPNTQGGNNGGWVGGGDATLYREVRLGLSTIGAESCRHFAKAQELWLSKHYMMPLAVPDNLVFYRKSKIKAVYQGYRGIDPINVIVDK